MDIVLLGFFAQLAIMYAVILVSEYRKVVNARSQATIHKLPKASKGLTAAGLKALAQDVRRRA